MLPRGILSNVASGGEIEEKKKKNNLKINKLSRCGLRDANPKQLSTAVILEWNYISA